MISIAQVATDISVTGAWRIPTAALYAMEPDEMRSHDDLVHQGDVIYAWLVAHLPSGTMGELRRIFAEEQTS
jgi:hypothetical protein